MAIKQWCVLLYSPFGRVSRKQIWMSFLLPVIFIGWGAAALDIIFFPVGIQGSGLYPTQILVNLIFLWPSIAVPIKRFHDRGMSGWWYLILLGLILFGFLAVLSPNWLIGTQEGEGLSSGVVALVVLAGVLIIIGTAIYWFVENYCLPGKAGPNRYGDDPLAPTAYLEGAFE